MGRSAGRRPRVARPATALAVGAFIVMMLACVAVIGSAAHQTKLSGLGLAALYLSFGLVGVVVAWHQPSNPMGWVLLGGKMVVGLAFAGLVALPVSIRFGIVKCSAPLFSFYL